MRADEVTWNRAVLAALREQGGGGRDGGDSLACPFASPVMEQQLVLSGHAARGVFERDLV